MRRRLAMWVLGVLQRRFDSDSVSLNRLMGRAIRLERGRITEDEFRQELDAYYARVDREALLDEISFATKAKRLERPGRYKVDVVALRSDGRGDRSPARWDLWGRRFGLLRRIGVRIDVLVLRAGEQVPPHAHYGVVSGFYVLEGSVAIRHYDRVNEYDGGIVVRSALKRVLDCGEFTTNSEFYQNIHWLLGVAPISFLFRITATDVPTQTFGGPNRTGSRIYVDPSGTADEHGLIRAPYVSAAAARSLEFPPIPSTSIHVVTEGRLGF